MRYSVKHITTYDYSDPVTLCHSTAHLQPRATDHQHCNAWNLHIDPQPETSATRQDYFGNELTHFTIQRPHVKLTVTAQSMVEIRCNRQYVERPGPNMQHVIHRIRRESPTFYLDTLQFVFESRLIRWNAAMREYALQSFPQNRSMLAGTADLTARIFRDFKYDKNATQVSTPVEEVWEKRRGVCQDFAHLQVAMLRSLGLAARYVSGYLLTKPPPGQQRLVGSDASHAWISVYCTESGWVDFDPTNDLVPWDRHIALAWGRDFSDVSPIHGVILGGGDHTVSVNVDVEPVMME